MFYEDIPNAPTGSVIDVRSEEEFYLMHVDGSINIPLDLLFYYLDELEELPNPWIFCCEEGVRSGRAVFLLRMIGHEDVYNGGRWIDIDHARQKMAAA